MRRLILLRHAKTEPRPAGVDDRDRALLARGRADAEALSLALAAAGVAPDLALVSPALRTRQTWDCLRDRFAATRVEACEALYDASPEDVAAEIALRREACETLLVVGHNPSLQELAISLLEEGAGTAEAIEAVSAGFPTSCAAVIEFDGQGRAHLASLFHGRTRQA